MVVETVDTMPESTREPTRRELLNWIWLASLGLLALQMIGAGIYYALPRFRQGEFGGRFKIGPVAELPSPGDPPLNVPKGKFWLVRTDRQLLALYKACTHLDCMFDWNANEGQFICPCHGSRFERDGRLVSGPAPRSLDQFEIRIVSPEGDLIAQSAPGKGLTLPAVAGAKGEKEAEGDTADSDEKVPESRGFPATSMVWVDTGRKYTGH